MTPRRRGPEPRTHAVPGPSTSRCKLGIAAVCIAASLSLSSSPSHAQFTLSLSQRAADGTIYQVIALPNAPLIDGVDEFQVTSVAAATNGLRGCAEAGNSSGLTSRALAGASPGMAQLLFGLDNVLRTHKLTPDDFIVEFDLTGSGHLLIGSGPGGIEVCRESASCAGGLPDATVVPASSSAGGVPPACLAVGVGATCLGSDTLNTYGFGLDTDSDGVCNSLPTTAAAICGARPADGFSLAKGEVVVFIYGPAPILGGPSRSLGIAVGASGFGIDSNLLAPSPCASVPVPLARLLTGVVVSADADDPGVPPTCAGSSFHVEPVTSPTNLPTQVISGCRGNVPFTEPPQCEPISASSEAGLFDADPAGNACPAGMQGYGSAIDLVPQSTNHVEVCLTPCLCPAQFCTTVDLGSQPLTIVTTCSLDVDVNGTAAVSTDLVYIARHLLVLPPVPASFRVLDPSIPSDTIVGANVAGLGDMLDVDMDGSVEVNTDIVYIVRRLVALPPVPASFRVLDPTIPSDAAIAAKVDALCPP